MRTWCSANILLMFFGLAPSTSAAPIGYEFGGPITLVGWSNDGTHIIRSGTSDQAKQLVTACPVAPGECKVLCHKDTCNALQLPQVQKMGLVKLSKPANVSNRSTIEGERVTKRTRLRDRIPGTSITVRLGKAKAMPDDGPGARSTPLFIGEKKVADLNTPEDGIEVMVYLSPDKRSVAVHVHGYAEAMESYDLTAYGMDSPSLDQMLDLQRPHGDVAKLAEGLVAAGTPPRTVAEKMNARGFHFYKKKDYKAAGQAFEAAHTIEPKYELPVLNRAGVAGLDGDAASCVKWLKVLKEIGTPKAKKLLTAQVAKDHDFDKVRNAAEFKAFMGSVR